MSPGGPHLVITEEPQDKFRYRYESELHGTHGCILGVNSTNRNKTFPTVELRNYEGPAVIRCSLYTVDQKMQHPHLLKEKIRNGVKPDPHEQEVSEDVGYKVTFKAIGIIQTARKKLPDVLKEKLVHRKLEEMDAGSKLTTKQKLELTELAEQNAQKINLNSVCLCFEAYVRTDKGALTLICPPVFSKPIHNMKSAQTNDLKIVRMDRFSGTCKGGDEIFIFVEKVNKSNIQIRFFELDDQENLVWQDKGLFSELDVHHQYAIAFRTPPYRPGTTLTENKKVYIELMRPGDNLRSEPMQFTYKPLECDIYPKRKRLREADEDSAPPVNSPSVNIIPVNSPPAPPDSSNGDLIMADQAVVNNPEPVNLCDLIPLDDGYLVDDEFFQGIPIDPAAIQINSLQDLSTYIPDPDELFDYVKNLIDESADVSSTGDPNVATDSIRIEKGTRKRELPKRQYSNLSFGKSKSRPVQSEDRLSDIATTQRKTANQPKDSSTKITEEDRKGFITKVIELVQKAEKESKLQATDIAKLIEKTIVLNAEKINALHTAVEFNQCEELETILRLLIKYLQKEKLSEILNAKDDNRQTPLYVSVLKNQQIMCKNLLEAGADAMIECAGKSPTELAMEQSNKDCFEILIKYLNETQKINEANSDGQSLLYKAVTTGNLPMVKLLVEVGASPNIGDYNSHSTPLRRAVENQNIDIIRYLLTLKDIQIDSPDTSGNTPLHCACVVGETGSVDIVQLLISAGADPWEENEDSSPSLNTDESVEKMMKKCKLDMLHNKPGVKQVVSEECINTVKAGKTAFDLAHDKPEILAILRQAPKSVLVEEMEEDQWEDASSDLHIVEEIKEEPPSPSEPIADALDAKTLFEVASILQQNDAWEDLARDLGLEGEIPTFKQLADPAKHLLIGCMGQVTTQELRDLLEALNQTSAVECIDNMITALNEHHISM